jgi:hypothetical protein
MYLVNDFPPILYFLDTHYYFGDALSFPRHTDVFRDLVCKVTIFNLWNGSTEQTQSILGEQRPSHQCRDQFTMNQQGYG